MNRSCVLNKNINEYDHLERHTLKDRIKDFFKKDNVEEKLEQLETELSMARLRETKQKKRYRNVVSENERLKEMLNKYERE